MRSLTSAGRGAHSLAMKTGRAVYESRENISAFLGLKNSERLLFTPGCTHSLNMVLKGFLADRLKDLSSDRRVIMLSSLEHNSIMRPLRQLERLLEFRCEQIPYQPGRFCHPEDVRESIRRWQPALLILTEGSNVTGEIADTKEIADVCREHRVPLLIDAAQTAGRFENCLAHDGVTFWCASAHKGLMALSGLGLLYVHPELDLEPLVTGGTGSASEQFDMPSAYPDHLESGTLPAFLVATLARAIDWLRGETPKKIQEHEALLAEHFLSWCRTRERVETFGFNMNPTAATQQANPGTVEGPAAFTQEWSGGSAAHGGFPAPASALERKRDADYRRERRELAITAFDKKRESDICRDRREGGSAQESRLEGERFEGSSDPTRAAVRGEWPLFANRLPIVSFRIAGITADVVADYLDRQADVAVRPGLHCAALAHRTLGTEDTGLVRVSFGYFNTLEEVALCCKKLDELLDGAS